MPKYCYQCECGKTKELIRKMSDRNNLVKCECKKPMKKLLSKPSLIGFDNNGTSLNKQGE